MTDARGERDTVKIGTNPGLNIFTGFLCEKVFFLMKIKMFYAGLKIIVRVFE